MANTKSKLRDNRGRFVSMKKIPANTNSIWLPNERWIAPSAEDRELVRKVVADADARIAAEHAHTTQAELDTYNAKQAAAHDMLDALPQQRDWLHTAGTALCLLPVISILLILLFRTGS